MKNTKWKTFIDYEKEEAWLNEMSSTGLALTNRFMWRYEFADCNPGEYIYRIDFLKKRPGSRESRKYMDFMVDSGIEHVSTQGYLVYYRRRAAEGPFEIYTDIDSKLSYYRRISNYWLLFSFMVALFIVEFAYFGIRDYFWTKEFMEIIKNLPPELELTDWWPYNWVLCIIYSAIFLGLLVVIFRNWNKIRKKVKRLKEEKNTRM